MTSTAIETPALILPEPVGLQYTWLDDGHSRKVGRVGRRGTKTRFDFLAAVHGHGPGWEDGTPKFPGILQGGDVFWFAVTYSNLSTVLWKEEIEPRFGPLADAGMAKLNKTDHDVKIRGAGSLFLRSAEPDAIRSIRGAGKNVVGAIIDEAAWLDLGGALKDIILPALLDNSGWLIITSTTNAGPDGGHDDEGRPMVPSYFNRLCAEIQRGERGPDWMEFTGTAYDNPTLEPKAIDELVAEYVPGSTSLRQEIYVELLEPGVGLALAHLSEKHHLVPAFLPKAGEWNRFAAFDWGYHHPWSFGLYLINADGQIVKQETLTGRHHLPHEIAASIKASGIDVTRLPIHSGGDCWRSRRNDRTSAGGIGPTIAEALMAEGWSMVPANDARVAGLNNFRVYTDVPDQAPEGFRPQFVWMDTPNNRLCLKQCKAMTLDPKNPEDALKIDADSSGRGGDDLYDETRYGLMSFPVPLRKRSTREDIEGRSLGYDYQAQEPRKRQTGEELMDQWLERGRNESPTAGRYHVPVRRG